MSFLAEWYDLRDIGNAVGELQQQITDWGAPDWVPYVAASLIGVVSILLWTILSVLAFIFLSSLFLDIARPLESTF